MDALDVLVNLAVGFGALAGVAGLVAAAVNVLKSAGIVRDGTAQKWAAGLNLAAFVVIALLGIFRPDVSLAEIDGVAAQATTVILFVSGLLLQIGLGGKWHGLLRGLPVIGTSFRKHV